MKFLLDTNTVIYYFKGLGNVSTQLLSYRPEQIAIPAIVLYELNVGILKSTDPKKRIHQLNTLLQHIRVLPFTDIEAEQAAKIRVELEQRGLPIGAYDILIAATAKAHQATLVTHNTKEFSRINGLMLTDWF